VRGKWFETKDINRLAKNANEINGICLKEKENISFILPLKKITSGAQSSGYHFQIISLLQIYRFI
jgi:hypothetical protein